MCLGWRSPYSHSRAKRLCTRKRFHISGQFLDRILLVRVGFLYEHELRSKVRSGKKPNAINNRFNLTVRWRSDRNVHLHSFLQELLGKRKHVLQYLQRGFRRSFCECDAYVFKKHSARKNLLWTAPIEWSEFNVIA